MSRKKKELMNLEMGQSKSPSLRNREKKGLSEHGLRDCEAAPNTIIYVGIPEEKKQRNGQEEYLKK